jgi:hypothetical protein
MAKDVLQLSAWPEVLCQGLRRLHQGTGLRSYREAMQDANLQCQGQNVDASIILLPPRREYDKQRSAGGCSGGLPGSLIRSPHSTLETVWLVNTVGVKLATHDIKPGRPPTTFVRSFCGFQKMSDDHLCRIPGKNGACRGTSSGSLPSVP